MIEREKQVTSTGWNPVVKISTSTTPQYSKNTIALKESVTVQHAQLE